MDEKKTGNKSLTIVALCIIAVLCIRLWNHSREILIYQSIVMPPTKDNAIYEHIIKTDTAEVNIEVVKIEVPDYLPDRYKMTIDLTNSTNTCYPYQVTVQEGANVWIFDSSKTEITYAESYSNGGRHNSKRNTNFIPSVKESNDLAVGSLEYILNKNDPTLDAGYVVIELTTYIPHTRLIKQIFAAQMRIDLT